MGGFYRLCSVAPHKRASQAFLLAVYDFRSINFTPAGQTGKTGPSLAMVQEAYASQAYWTSNPAFLDVNQYGVQVPISVSCNLLATVIVVLSLPLEICKHC